MKSADYTVAVQHGNLAYYAKVSMNVASEEPGTGLQIDMDPAIDQRWSTALLFGIEYAAGCFRRAAAAQSKIKVKVTNVGWQLSDTTNISMALAAIHAFWKAVEFSPDRGPVLDLPRRQFCLPL